jgi:cytochrome d ubiquinol oxidase subunit I
MFGIIYAMLFAIWVYVLNHKIHHGPEEMLEMPAETTPEGLLDAAARLATGYSLTLAKDEPVDVPDRRE